ncbi:PEPxxWA-CTERM sorting domain-containing protein [Erythrobacter sp. QSSC1-22B]|uniref:PEPxxWA-CTERM sorting domain-containing protein n=1 Tax=Erythrobacter sp. QSSC1-22B TaxID=1860125 RepID=UPI000833F2CA|nr:PEPxxWA-CTERM sorting domain-containing protein [Erythrobacter sp. QSSC1-22B]
MRKIAIFLAGAALFVSPISAANLAIFGMNNIGNLYDDSHIVTYVTDAQLATPGFLATYDAFVYTRDGASFGVGLSPLAASNVKSYVTGNVVLFNGDFQDDIGDPDTNTLFINALNFVLSGGAGGYIGEYTGAFSAYSANGDGYSPIGLVQGAAGPSGFGLGGSDTDIDITAAGMVSPVTAGVTFPYNPAAVEFGAELSGENPDRVLARFATGNAAIIASSVDQISVPTGVPEPGTWAMMLLGFGFIGGAMRSAKRRQKLIVSYA